MAFSYDAAELNTPLNHLRFLVQDTVDAGHFFEDEEITFVLGQESNIFRAAARLCRTIAAKLAKTPDAVLNEDVVFQSQTRAREYRLLAEDFDNKAEHEESINSNSANNGGSLNLPKIRCSTPAFTRKTHFSS